MKKKREKREPPVPTGHDERGRQAAIDEKRRGREPKAPDGVSGDWG